MWRCKNCKFEFIEPAMNEEDLSKYYPKEDYYSLKKYNSLAVFYHNLSAKYWMRPGVLNPFLKPIEPLFYKYYGQRGDSILEIGAGSGLKLEIYQKNGLRTTGLEPHGQSLSRREKCLGILRRNVKNARLAENSFDYILLKEVIEHVPDQKLLLKKCFDWLKPGGKLVITTQNSEGIWKKVFGKDWFGYDVPRHVYSYNLNNLKFTLVKYGFRVVNNRTYDNPYMIDGSLMYRFTYGQKRSFIGRIVFSNMAKIAFTPLSLAVSYLGLGSLMEVECTK